MSEMVEIVAREIARVIHADGKWPWPPGYSSLPIDNDDVRDMARAAIVAMREPTEAMVRAGLDTAAAHSWGSRGDEFITNPEAFWETMIDEELKTWVKPVEGLKSQELKCLV